jgi:protocatechuate 3,4-dioxygenase beta subunit
MSDRTKLSRRALLAAGAGLAAGTAGTGAMAGVYAVTPANPEGPFYPGHKQADTDADLTLIEGHEGRATGEVVRVTGRVLDEDGKPIAGAVVDVWQANSYGRYHHEADPATAPLDPDFQGWAVMKTDADGRYAFRTIKPGAYRVGGDWTRPPHIHFRVSRRGYHELTTQMYFAGEELNERDRLLQSVPAQDRGLLVVAFDESKDVPEGDFPVVLGRVG